MAVYSVKFILEDECEANILGSWLEQYGLVNWSDVSGKWSCPHRPSKAAARQVIRNVLRDEGVKALERYAHSPGVKEIAEEILKA